MNNRFSLHRISASAVLAGAILGSGIALGDESPRGPQPAAKPEASASAAPGANDVKAVATDDVKAAATSEPSKATDSANNASGTNLPQKPAPISGQANPVPIAVPGNPTQSLPSQTSNGAANNAAQDLQKGRSQNAPPRDSRRDQSGPVRHQTNRAYSNNNAPVQPNADRDGRTNVNIQSQAGANVRYNTSNLGLNFGAAGGNPLVISSIGANGYFGNVGFLPGDRILSAGGQQFTSNNAFYSWLGTAAVGQRVPIIVQRNGQQQTIYWTPNDEFVQQYTQSNNNPGPQASFLGIHLDDQVQDSAVVASVDPNSPAQQAGIRPDDVVVAVGGQQVASPSDFVEATSRLPQESAVDMAIARTINVRLNNASPIGQTGAQPLAPTVQPAAAPRYQPRGGLLRRGR